MSKVSDFKRRQFLHLLTGLGVGTLAGVSGRLAHADDLHSGPYLIALQVNGGWDPTSFCDPKINIPGEPVINNWAQGADIEVAGRIPYAPWAANTDFFNKYHRDMLVINGVDAQTNSHSTGVLHNWSGHNSAGLPSLGAMFSALHAPDQPLSYFNFGGFQETGGLIRSTRLDNYQVAMDLLQPRTVPWDRARTFFSDSESNRLNTYRAARRARLLTDASLPPLAQRNLEAFDSAINNRGTLGRMVDQMPPAGAIRNDQRFGESTSSLLRQVQFSLAGMSAGLTAAADIFVTGFDTHGNHDGLHQPLLTHLTEAIDFIWEQAAAYGIADRLTLLVGSDFGRTPFYNAEAGKDHWPIGSFLVMESNPVWGNRVVGITDEGHNALKIDPLSLQEIGKGGTVVYPKHIHKALRRHLGLEGTWVEAGFALDTAEELDLFNPDLRTL